MVPLPTMLEPSDQRETDDDCIAAQQNFQQKKQINHQLMNHLYSLRLIVQSTHLYGYRSMR